MGYEERVLWHEGMFLTPHHFQQADRYRDFQLRKRIGNLGRFDWGLGRLRIDHDALLGGEFRVIECQAVMRDGLLVDVPDHDSAPVARSIKEFFDSQTTCLGVYLAIAVAAPGEAVASTGEQDSASGTRIRYHGDYLTIGDENRDGQAREIQTARKNLRILFEGESLDGFVCLRMVEVRRDASGEFHLDGQFLPAAYALSASENMMPHLRNLLANLSSRRDALAGQRRKTGSNLARFAPSEAATFWLLHTINVHLPVLAHFEKQPRTHPETLYLELVRLAGALMTFSESGSTDALEYDHDNLTATFAATRDLLEQLLETVIPQRCKLIGLRGISESVFSGEIDASLLGSAEFYLAVRCDVGEDKLIREVPIKAKITSADRLQLLITAAVRGIPIRHLPNPPTDLFEPGKTYFQLEKVGEHWDAVCQAHTVSVYVPPEFTHAQVELMAVTE